MSHPHKKVPSRFDHFQRRAEVHASEFWAFFKPFMLGAFTVMATLIFAIAGIHFTLAQSETGAQSGMMTGQPPMGNFPMMGQQHPGTDLQHPPMGSPQMGDHMPRPSGDHMMPQPSGMPACKPGEACSPPGGDHQPFQGGPDQNGNQPFSGRPSGPNFSDPSHAGQGQGNGEQGNGGQDQKRQAQMEEQNQKQQAQMEERQKKDEERQKKQMAQQFAGMKKQMAPLASVLKRITTRIASLEKQGVTAPADLKNQIDATDQALKTILSADSMDADGVQDAMGTLQENNQSMRESFQKLEQLAQVPRMIKQAEREVKRADTSLARAKKMAAQSKIDLSDPVQKLSQVVDDMRAGFEKAKQLLASGDGEGAMSALQDEVYGKTDDVRQLEELIRTLQNIRAHLSQFDRFVTQAKRGIAKLQKANEDTADVQAQLDEMTTKLSELKQLTSQKISDPDALKDAVDGIFQNQEAISEALGSSSAFPQSPQPHGEQGGIKEFQDFQQFNFGSQQGTSNH